MTKDEAIKVLEMVEAHGLAKEAKEIAIEALKTEAIPISWLENFRNSLESNREEWLKLAISFLIIAYSVEMEEE